MSRRPTDPRKAAEDVFKRTAPKLPEPEPVASSLPGARETVTLRIDRDVIELFQADGPGWQERINAALRTFLKK